MVVPLRVTSMAVVRVLLITSNATKLWWERKIKVILHSILMVILMEIQA